MSASRILIVDDDPALLIALTGALEIRMPNAAVDTCDSGTAAVEKVSQIDYDAVVSDIKMPGMDGLALLKEVRALRPELPTLLITGHGQHDLAVQALRGGAFDFIQKPIERDYFVASLARAIRMRKMERQLRQQREDLANHTVELERMVEARTMQLQEANRRKDEFLAMLSHELRNPLAPIRSGLEILALEEGHDLDIIEQMQEQLQHLVRLVDDLLDVSRIMRGKIDLRKERVELSAVIKQAVSVLTSQAESRCQELVITLPQRPVWLHGDRVRLVQVVQNLLHNSIKYTDAGGRIELGSDSQDGQVAISIRDTGIGIEPELLPEMFDLFIQSSRARHRAEGGLGIGLTLVQRLVEMHEGSISAQSDGPGRGSTFVVRLPTVQSRPPVAQPVESPVACPTRHILVVDDNISAARMLSMLLTKRGNHVVDMAHDGPSALAQIKERHPDIVLLDIGLPGMDGSQVARAVRQIDECRNVMLVAVTGYGQEEDHRRSIEAGFDRHLVKPIELKQVEELLTTIEETPNRSSSPNDL